MELTDFQRQFFSQIGMVASHSGWPITYNKPHSPADNKRASIKKSAESAHEFVTFYHSEKRFTFVVADYTIAHNFTLSFKSTETFLRFGIVTKGTSRFNIENNTRQTFYPSPYLTYETQIKGQQHWEKGQHYQAIEFFIDPRFLHALAKRYPKDMQGLSQLVANHVYLSLPLEVLDQLWLLKQHHEKGTLSALDLESRVLSCLSLLLEAINLGKYHTASRHSDVAIEGASRVSLGIKRWLKLSEKDMLRIREAKTLIDTSLPSPPTVQDISAVLNLSQQKLTYGFKSLYQETIGTYIKNHRLLTAANLLSSSDLSVKQIALSVGYSCTPNFCNAFKHKFKQSPIGYRNANQIESNQIKSNQIK